MNPTPQGPAGDYANADPTLNIAPSKLVAIDEKIASLVPELRFDVLGSFCLRDGVSLTGSPGRPPLVQASIQGGSHPADLGDDNNGGTDGATFRALFGHGERQYANVPCFMHVYLNDAGTEIPVNVRVFLRALAACKSVADLKALITKYSPDTNTTNVETRWPWVVKAVNDSFAAQLAAIQSVTGGLDSPAVTGLPFQIMGPVTRIPENNALKAMVSIQGAPAIALAVTPDGKAYDERAQQLTWPGVDVNALYAAMQQAAG